MCETPHTLHRAPSGPGERVLQDVESNVEFETKRVFLTFWETLTPTAQNPRIWAILGENVATGGTSLPS